MSPDGEAGIVDDDRMATQAERPAPPLLAPDDPAPFRWVNRGGRAPYLLVCDHASRAVPARLAGLGLDGATIRKHIGWDIGAALVTEYLARRFDAPAVLAGYSRLVIDCNRYPGTPPSILARSDGITVPGNQALPAAEAASRAAAIFWPYHAAIDAALDDFGARGITPVLFAIHSMTPEMNGEPRPWQIALSWDLDGRLAGPTLAALAGDPEITVGENQPYRLDLGDDYTIPEHAMRRGLAHLQVEFRQDLVAEAAGARAWGEGFARALENCLDDPRLHAVEHYWP